MGLASREGDPKKSAEMPPKWAICGTGHSLCYCSIPAGYSARTLDVSSGLLYKLPIAILPAKCLNVFGMWHMLVIPEAVAHEGAL